MTPADVVATIYHCLGVAKDLELRDSLDRPFVLVPWADGIARFPARAVVALAVLIVLTHPAHLPAAVALVVLAALVAPPRGRRLATAVAGLAIAALVTAFWTLPLIARLTNTRALATGNL